MTVRANTVSSTVLRRCDIEFTVRFQTVADVYARRVDPQRAGELLRRERERITESLTELEPARDDEQTADSAAELYDAELDEGRYEDLRAQLAAVERAEQRLADGTYGLSIESGEPIPAERLEALPTVERTIEEQERYDHGA